MSCGGVVWATIAVLAGRPLPALVPASYVLLTANLAATVRVELAAPIENGA